MSDTRVPIQPGEDPWTDTRLRSALDDYATLKSEGNTHFTQKNWQNAFIAYQQALEVLPPAPVADTKDKGKVANDEDSEDEEDKSIEQGAVAMEASATESDKTNVREDIVQSPLEKECSAARVVLQSNMAQCHLKLEEWQKAVDACTTALQEDSHHPKTLWRRAKANEALDTWSTLSAAQTDYETLINTVPQSDSLYWEAKKALRILEPRLEEVKKRDVDKMMGQLKGVGDSILGWFGMSTDNFKMAPNGQGGYSLNFVNNPSSASGAHAS